MYFEKSGKINTEETVKMAMKTAKERNTSYIVLVTSKGGSSKLS